MGGRYRAYSIAFSTIGIAAMIMGADDIKIAVVVISAVLFACTGAILEALGK